MKRKILTILCAGLLLGGTNALAQESKTSAMGTDPKKKTMTWTTSSPKAKELASSGVGHVMNNETELGYYEISEALKLDPDFTIALAFIANMSYGETKKAYAARTLKSAATKTEGEKLFATLADEKNTPEINRGIWEKLKTMFPDGGTINYFYVVTREKPDEQLTAALAYAKQFPDVAAINNVLGYNYLNRKDNQKAKEYFEKYISMRPDGYNPYDSMGEFYLLTGDSTNAEKYYTMALEKYPFFTSSINALEKINAGKPKPEKPKAEVQQ